MNKVTIHNGETRGALTGVLISCHVMSFARGRHLEKGCYKNCNFSCHTFLAIILERDRQLQLIVSTVCKECLL